MALKNRIIINDGFNPELAEGARFESKYEIPIINAVEEIRIPKYLVPFSERNKTNNPADAFVMFYEHDDKFADIIRDFDKYINDLARFAGVISPDNSLYRDMPLACQICNIYRNRLVGSYLQRKGITVIGNCRWGDERTYLPDELGEPISFIGLPKESIVSVGTYGCIQGKINKTHFKRGLGEMLNYLRPKVVLVYGSMLDEVFGEFRGMTRFVGFNDWTSIRHKEDKKWGAE